MTWPSPNIGRCQLKENRLWMVVGVFPIGGSGVGRGILLPILGRGQATCGLNFPSC